MIRHADIKDIDRLVELAHDYFKESMFYDKRKLNDDRILETIGGAVFSDDWIVLVGEVEEKIEGYLIAYENYSFFTDNEIDIDFFYISAAARGTGLSRRLIEYIKGLAALRNIGIIYCGCHSNMNDDGRNNSLFTNLFKRQGFEVTGTNLHLLMETN